MLYISRFDANQGAQQRIMSVNGIMEGRESIKSQAKGDGNRFAIYMLMDDEGIVATATKDGITPPVVTPEQARKYIMR